jgi:hypothetical protein
MILHPEFKCFAYLYLSTAASLPLKRRYIFYPVQDCYRAIVFFSPHRYAHWLRTAHKYPVKSKIEAYITVASPSQNLTYKYINKPSYF